MCECIESFQKMCFELIFYQFEEFWETLLYTFRIATYFYLVFGN